MTGWYCHACGDELTAEEHHYYHDRCETCERAWSDRITAWRKGGHDPELDDAYGETHIVH